MEKISRKGFLKATAAAAVSAAAASVLSSCSSTSSAVSSSEASSAGMYIPGTYTGTATGMGEVKVTMTFTEDAITEVTVDTSNETLDLAVNSAEDFRQALEEAQSAEIDTISGATYTSDAVKKAAASCIEQAMGVQQVEEPVAEPAAESSSGFLACEELEGVNAAGQGEIAFVAEPIADSELANTIEVDVLVCGQGPALSR